MSSISTRLLGLGCVAASLDVCLDQPAQAVMQIAMAHAYGRQATDPDWDRWQVKEPQQLAPMTRHGSLHWLWHDSRMHSFKQTTSLTSHTTWHCPDLQTSPSPHVPQLPSQPSLPQFLESQFGVQICVGGGGGDDPWQAPAVAPSRSSFFRAFLETVTVCPARQSVTFFFLFPFLASTS
jgi:hypothetical protein